MSKNYVIECGEIVINHTGNIRGAKTKALKIATENNNVAWIYVESNEYALPLTPVDNVYSTETNEKENTYTTDEKLETLEIIDENLTKYSLDTMINTINDIINNNVLLNDYKIFNIYGVSTKMNINIFVNECFVVLRLYDDLTIIDKVAYNSVEYKKTLFRWLKYLE